MQKTLNEKISEQKKLLHRIIPEIKTGNINSSNIQVLFNLENFLEELNMDLMDLKNKI